ncbi:hypothetical protein [Pseudomonas sp. TTU2014-080ASC]|uniref:hypothetical protein n=1 Tax=Pseudomonas sp. TTU2014-080ASC TaxID=1729724 RepID=UPI000718A84E|nr:hypothetical protein [Pseudomonas sp. TTU2014-080ASC]KRW62606.1 hypothetical protein AO726_04095 [Pseudomonas sp. TTU2014-080ASC]
MFSSPQNHGFADEAQRQLTQSNPPTIYSATPRAGLIDTAAIYAQYAAWLGSWIPLAQFLDQAY